MKVIKIEEIIERIKEKWPNQPFEIIEYTKVSKPFTIKCLKCNQIKTYSSFGNYIGTERKGLCGCYNENNNFTKHENNKKKILKLIKDSENSFVSFGYKETTRKYLVIINCNKCNQPFTKTWQDYLKNQSCPYCENKQKMNTQAFKTLLSEEYELLSEYKGQNEKILVRHNCGFIWKINAHNFLSHIGCPKCNKKRSAGEQKIQKFLDNNFITNQIEVSFDWQSNKKRRYDFYLPEYNLIIEYMGEQHYRDCSLFKVSLTEQQEIDKIKKEECLNNNYNYLAISYKDFNSIEDILKQAISSTTNLKGVDLSKSKE